MNPEEIYDLYINRKVIELPEDLRTSKSLDYVVSKFEELKAFERGVNEECVIGIWGFPMPHGRHEGYGLYTRREYNALLNAQAKNTVALIHLAPKCYDKNWFKRKIEKRKGSLIID